MGKLCTAEDYQRMAEENVLVPRAHEEEDSKQQTKNEPNNRYKIISRRPWISKQGDLSDRMLDDSIFRYYFQPIVLNAGSYGELTIHALRHPVANEVDSKDPSPSLLCPV